MRRVRHLDLCHFYVKELIEDHGYNIKKIPGTENCADVFTKSLGPTKLSQMRTLVGLSIYDENHSHEGGVA